MEEPLSPQIEPLNPQIESLNPQIELLSPQIDPPLTQAVIITLVGKGKRGATAPLAVNSSDDEEPEAEPSHLSSLETPLSPEPLTPRSSPHDEHDYACSSVSPPPSSSGTPGTPSTPGTSDPDYDNVSSPGSSTASGPTYVRQPGFTHHAHEVVVVSKPKIKKKKTAVFLSVKDGLKKAEPTPPKIKPKRDPLPMRLRALPQSFWQQPNVPHNVPPGAAYPVLPPLPYGKEADNDIADVRPVTPPVTPPNDEKPDEKVVNTVPDSKPARPTERKLTVANTDLLFKLFENVDKDRLKRVPGATHLKRGRTRKMVNSSNKSFLNGQDPYLVDCVSENLFPQLSLEQSKAHATIGGNATLQLVTLREGDKSVTLPALSMEQNYSQMLSELVMHI